MKTKFWICLVLAGVLLSGSPAAAAGPSELRVVGSWNSLTVFKNFEQPFWTEVVPKELGIKTSLTSLGQVNLKGPAVLRATSMGVYDVVHTVADYVVDDSPALAGLDRYRVRRLEDRGLIRGYRASVDCGALGLGLQAMVMINLGRHQANPIEDFEAEIRAVPEVRACFHVTGRYDYLAHVVVRDIDHLRELVTRLKAK